VPATLPLVTAYVALGQQVELASALANSQKSKMTKGKFNELAKAYRARNEAKRYAMKKLGSIGYSFFKKVCWEISKGAYDKDWEIEGHPKLESLIQAVRDEWEKRHRAETVSVSNESYCQQCWQ